MCNNCKLVEEINRYLKANKNLKESNKKMKFPTLDTKKGEGQQLYKDIFKGQISNATRNILLKWLMFSKSRILHTSSVSETEMLSARKLVAKEHQKFGTMLPHEERSLSPKKSKILARSGNGSPKSRSKQRSNSRHLSLNKKRLFKKKY
jgi:hypothetical protein